MAITEEFISCAGAWMAFVVCVLMEHPSIHGHSCSYLNAADIGLSIFIGFRKHCIMWNFNSVLFSICIGLGLNNFFFYSESVSYSFVNTLLSFIFIYYYVKKLI